MHGNQKWYTVQDMKRISTFVTSTHKILYIYIATKVLLISCSMAFVCTLISMLIIS